MSVRKDPSGRRWVEVEIEVPGTLEQVWEAIASGPGVSAWFVPTEVRADGTVVCHFGPGMDQIGKPTLWEPPRRFAARTSNFGLEGMDGKEDSMRITLTSVMVDDQEKALAFYAGTLGFVKLDIPMGPFKFLTVVSPEEPDGTQLLLEPNANPAARAFQEVMMEQGIPLASFGVADIQKEHQRLVKLGVSFTTGPTKSGPATLAVFKDTCGNLIQIAQT